MPSQDTDRRHDPSPSASASRLDLLLHSNTAPSDIETGAIQDILATSQAKGVQLFKQITQTQDLLNRLQAEHLNAELNRKKYRNVLSPLRRLPAEVLSEILTQCKLTWCRESLNTCQRPWTFTYVCRHWRRVAISTPQLWTSIKINNAQPAALTFPSELDTQLTLLRLHLERAGGLPLQVQFTFGFPGNHHACLPLFEKLIEHSNRWESISLTIDSQCHASLLGSLKGPLMMLQSLDIVNRDSRPGHEQQNWSMEPFNAAPYLQHIKVVHCSFSRKLRSANLITYNETGILTPVFTILSDSPLLKHLTLNGWKYWDTIPTPVHHSNLQSLELSNHCSIAYLTLPALENLKLTLHDDEDHISTIVSFIRRSSCSLKLLSIDQHLFNGGTPDFIALYQSIPALKLLSVYGLPELHLPLMARPLITKSRGSPRSPILLPKLTSITISIRRSLRSTYMTPPDEPAVYHSFVDMVWSRGPENAIQTVDYLRQIIFIGPDTEHSGVISKLLDLDNDEVKVVVRLS